MEKLKLDRISCHVTAQCNLRCDKCSAYIPKLSAYPPPPRVYNHGNERIFFHLL